MKKFLMPCFALVCSAAIHTATAASLDSPVLQRGEEVYRTTCTNSFCHGVGGIQGSAPRLAAREFDAMYIANITANGVPNTPMAGFANALSSGDLNAVMTYVASLNGIYNPRFTSDDPLASLGIEVVNPRRIPLAGREQEGRELFFDAYGKGIRRCSTCHEMEGIGIPVAAPIMTVPATVRALRNLNTPAVQRATLNGDSMPALVLSQSVSGSKFYDLTSVPPVLRTVQPEADLTLYDSGNWQHQDYLSAYSTEELDKVLAFLRAITVSGN